MAAQADLSQEKYHLKCSKEWTAAVSVERRRARQKGRVGTVANWRNPGLSYRSVATWLLTVCFHGKSQEVRTSDFSRKAGNLDFSVKGFFRERRSSHMLIGQWGDLI